MRFIVIGRDGTDAEAPARRQAVRDAHLKLGNQGIQDGNFLMAAALLDDNHNMIGSVMLVDFEDRAALDAWLKVEPYVTGDVWKDIEVCPAAVGPSFEQFLRAA